MSFIPELIVNHKGRREKVLTTILEELSNCSSFEISVAFITQSGVASIIEVLKKLEQKGVKGRILSSTYLHFTQPNAIESLLQFSNLEIKMDVANNFHSKGFLFAKSDSNYSLYIGSSNLTSTALTTNVELNVGLQYLSERNAFLKQYRSDFNEYWEGAVFVDQDFIDRYSELYNSSKKYRAKQKLETTEVSDTESPFYQKMKPNKMQLTALTNLKRLRASGANKALLISATGTGKTFLSAFDVERLNPGRILFVVHRRTIAQKSLETFQRLMPHRTMSLYSGTERGSGDFLFATIQTVVRDISQSVFTPDDFDYVIIDETHRAEANSFRSLLGFFNPAFLLGMTATPERADGGDIFKLFDHNIAYEIRLHQALEEEMLAPFHYYGVTDLTIDGETIDDHSDFNKLVSDERVKHIVEKANFYRCDSGKVCGLIFCSRKAEAHELAARLSDYGFKVVAITGESKEDERKRNIDQLEEGLIDYIITVDIFNEGIDIPSVNQVIMLRPTQSAIIFVQQLGRGLRKTDGKEYLTVIDFIGNYSNTYLIPIALYGDTSFNKDSIRKLLVGGSQGLPGSCTIDFDEISQSQVFDALAAANLSRKKDLEADYKVVLKIIGRNPMMLDFLEHGARDPFHYIEYSGSLYQFANLIGEGIDTITALHEEVLSYCSKFVNDGKRILDSIIFSLICDTYSVSISAVKEEAFIHLSREINDSEIITALHCVNLSFDIIRFNKQDARISDKLGFKLVEFDDKSIVRTVEFNQLLSDRVFNRYLKDSSAYSIAKFKERILGSQYYGQDFVLYEKYTRRDVLRILGWDKNRNATTIGGYRMSPDKSNCPIFVTYHKADDVEGSIAYEDEFISPSEFRWMSRSNRRIDSNELEPIIKARSNGLRLPLFLKKDDNEGIDFYYLGDVLPIDNSIEQQYMPDDNGKKLPVVKFEFELNPPVELALYKYFQD
jgi:superfamily II DNA or RNA helicase/HKD family nuclease